MYIKMILRQCNEQHILSKKDGRNLEKRMRRKAQVKYTQLS